nr:hypothetical protein [Tanacetum cinerariifolium]
MAKAFKLNYSTPTNNNQRISSNLRNKQIAQPSMNMSQDRQMQMVGGNGGNQFRQNCTVRPRRRDAAYLQTQLLIDQKEEAGIQLQAKEYDLMVAAADLDDIKEVNANCILMANLQETVEQYHVNFEETHALYESLYQNLATEVEKVNSVNRKLKETNADMTTQASTSGTQTDRTPVYDSDGSAEVSSVEQSGGTVEQHPANVEDSRDLYDSLYNNLAIKVEKVNTVNRRLRETNAELTTELPSMDLMSLYQEPFAFALANSYVD